MRLCDYTAVVAIAVVFVVIWPEIFSGRSFLVCYSGVGSIVSMAEDFAAYKCILEYDYPNVGGLTQQILREHIASRKSGVRLHKLKIDKVTPSHLHWVAYCHCQSCQRTTNPHKTNVKVDVKADVYGMGRVQWMQKGFCDHSMPGDVDSMALAYAQRPPMQAMAAMALDGVPAQQISHRACKKARRNYLCNVIPSQTSSATIVPRLLVCHSHQF